MNRSLNVLPQLTARGGRGTGCFDRVERDALLGPFRSPQTRAHLSLLLGGLRRERAWFAKLEAEVLPRLSDVPVRLIYGAHDNGGRAGHAERFARALPQAEIVRLARSAHFPTEDEPEALTEAIAKPWPFERDNAGKGVGPSA